MVLKHSADAFMPELYKEMNFTSSVLFRIRISLFIPEGKFFTLNRFTHNSWVFKINLHNRTKGSSVRSKVKHFTLNICVYSFPASSSSSKSKSTTVESIEIRVCHLKLEAVKV